ncbi:NAD-dependent epimerase/dehydratase family protein [Chryseobacterium jejuense]|uniref:dTDP-L-rhamnose 4-epimerase n=1 Tax=Chryseobacterium jejuense TaxID=445960 RepID=A0A2X2WZ58_CHRJE|nr:NAD-dependent epimerase/dehydratase family protein [Chryseobacterium jejuense]SDJ35048.1 dTDP-L-rhamnose 4-epimerase [Chryseobacterium jejuense]SQB45774.1 dTDP-glucose 4,6-dehydratase [Chryseobacterium jejuense]
MKKILITGGAGFIGSNLALKLIDKGYQVTVLDNLSPQIHGENPAETSPLYLSIKDKVKFILGTVTSEEDWKKAIEGQDAIVHYAAETGTGQSMYEVKKYIEVNINGTALLLDLLVNTKHSIKKVVVASSRSIYGEGKYISQELGVVYPTQRTADYMDQEDFEVKYPGSSALTLVGTDETSKIHPSSVYGITKQNQEQMVLTVCQTIGISGVAFRYQNVYGPGQSLKNPYTGILSIFSTQIKNGNKINIFEDGKESRDFVFIDDVVDATILGLEKEEANNQVFNVGTGIATNVLEVANGLVKNYGVEVPIVVSGNYRLGDIRHNYADLTKINTLLGFEPKVTFEKGLKKFTDWVNTQEVQEDQYQKSIDEMKAKGLYK